VGFLVFDQYVLERDPDTTQGAPTASTQADDPSSNLVRRYSIIIGQTRPKGGAMNDAEIALSSDGRRLVYAVQREDTSQLYLRELDLVEAQALPGTEGAFNPFFSPDGEWIGFFRGEGIHTVSVRGGPTKEVSGPAIGGPGSFWSPDDTILFTADTTEDSLINTGIAGDRYDLVRSAAVGGTPEPLALDTGMQNYIYAWPHVLPDGESFLFTASEFGEARAGNVFLFSPGTGETRILIRGAYNARYAPTGHIIFMRSAALWAVPFDLESMQTKGREVPVIEGIQTGGDRGQAVYAFSDDGLLIYLPGFDTQYDEESDRRRTLTWVYPDGSDEIITGFEPGWFANPQLSPDGQFLAITVRTETTGPNENWDIWIYDLERQTTSRLTFDPSNDQRPLWTPDGQHIVYTRLGDDGGLFRQAANGTGIAERLTELTELTLGPRAESFSPDGAYLVFRAQSEANGGWNLYLLSLSDEPTTQPLLQEDFSEFRSDISPDGRWIAYTSNETGENEVYVRPFPNVENGKWQISAAGGSEPLWGSEGRDLFYLGNLDNSVLVRVDIDTDSGFKAGSPEVLFLTDGFQTAGNSAPNYDLSSNGQQFLMLKNFERASLEGPTELMVVDNWFEELKRLAPVDAPREK
jgi:Tol biopolymer transport system component